jgi:CxxC-x17-CxxC domain-containing protein
LADRTLTCRDCGQSFVYTEGEQEFYTSRGFSDPVRCPSCRAAKKANRGGGGNDYGDSYGGGGGYSSGGYSSGYSDSYGGGGYGGERRERTMTTVTCSNCGRETQVPFVPTGARPVYCSDCYSQMGGGNRGGGGGRRY